MCSEKRDEASWNLGIPRSPSVMALIAFSPPVLFSFFCSAAACHQQSRAVSRGCAPTDGNGSATAGDWLP